MEPEGPIKALRFEDVRRILGVEKAARCLLLGGVMPLWLGAGLAGWYLHRRTRIEQTAGLRESHVHHLMFGETGVPALTAHRVAADEDQPGAREPEAGHDLRRHPGGVQDEQAAQEI